MSRGSKVEKRKSASYFIIYTDGRIQVIKGSAALQRILDRLVDPSIIKKIIKGHEKEIRQKTQLTIS
jgi:hypothetical protein